MMVHAFNPSTWEVQVGDLLRDLVYVVRSYLKRNYRFDHNFAQNYVFKR